MELTILEPQYTDEGEYLEEEVTYTIPDDEAADILEQALAGTLDNVNQRTIKREIERRENKYNK